MSRLEHGLHQPYLGFCFTSPFTIKRCGSVKGCSSSQLSNFFLNQVPTGAIQLRRIWLYTVCMNEESGVMCFIYSNTWMEAGTCQLVWRRRASRSYFTSLSVSAKVLAANSTSVTLTCTIDSWEQVLVELGWMQRLHFGLHRHDLTLSKHIFPHNEHMHLKAFQSASKCVRIWRLVGFP